MDISVIIPIFNVEEYLQECLDSVWSNVEHLRAEVILVDDGSTDGSSAIARSFAKKHKQFAYYRKNNGGPSAARNLGLRHARGRYLFFVDADDILMEDTLPTMLKVARTGKADMTVCDVGRLQPNGSITLSVLHGKAFLALPNNTTNIREHPQLAYDTVAWNKLIRHSFFMRRAGSFPEGQDVCEDYAVMFPLYCEARKVSVVRSMGYLWRVREGDNPSLTQQRTKVKNLHDRIMALDSVFAYLAKHDGLESVRTQVENKLIGLDFNGYISNLQHMDSAQAHKFVELMAATVERHVSPRTIERAPLKTRQMMCYLLERNVKGLIAWDKYVRSNYATAAFRREGDALFFDSPCDLLTVDSRNVLPDVRVANPLSYVDYVHKDGDVYTIKGHLYTPRVSIADPTEQTVRAFLVNDLWGTRIPLPCTSCVCEHLTASRGTLASTDGTTHTYNYDGTGFELVLDLVALNRQQRLDGNNAILLEYENWVKHDYRILRGAAKRAERATKKASYQDEQGKSTIVWDQRNTLFVRVERVPMRTQLRRKARALKRRLLNRLPW